MLELVSHLAFLFVSLWKTYTETCIHSSAFVWHNFVLLGNMKVIALTLIMKMWVQQHTHCCENGEHLWINPTPGKNSIKIRCNFSPHGEKCMKLSSFLPLHICLLYSCSWRVCVHLWICVRVCLRLSWIYICAFAKQQPSFNCYASAANEHHSGAASKRSVSECACVSLCVCGCVVLSCNMEPVFQHLGMSCSRCHMHTRVSSCCHAWHPQTHKTQKDQRPPRVRVNTFVY